MRIDEARFKVHFTKDPEASSFRVVVTDDDAEPVVLYECLVAADPVANAQRKALHDMARYLHWFIGNE